MLLYNRFAVSLLFLINGFVYANWVARLPKIQALYGMDNATLGLVLLATSLGALCAMPFTGWLIIKFGSRRVTTVAALSFCCVIPFIPLLAHIWQLWIVFFAMGMVTGSLDVAMNAQAVLVEQGYQKPIMSSFHAAFSIGMMLGAGSGALFTKWQIALFPHFVVITLAAILFLIWAVYYLITDKPTSKPESSESSFRLPDKKMASIGMIAFCCMLGEGSMADWTTNYMQNTAHASEALAPIALVMFSMAMTLGRILGDKVREIMGDQRLLIASGSIATVGLCIALGFPTPYFVIFGLFLVGIGLSVVVPIAYSIAGNNKDFPPGVALAMVTTVGYAGFLFGPPIIGFLADTYSLRLALGFVLLLFILMAILSRLIVAK